MMNEIQCKDFLVTIITVVYNGEKTIARTIESVLAQTYNNIEYIIVDGASIDKTLDIIKRYEGLFGDSKRLTIISEHDNGMYEALNKGVRMAHGVLIGNINADDWYEPNAVEEMVKLFRVKEYDIAWADLMIHGKKNTFIKKAKVGMFWTTAHFCHPTMFSRREILLQYPYLENNLDDDFDMILRVNNAGANIVTLNKVLAHYSLGGLSTRKDVIKIFERIAMKRDTYVRNGYKSFYIAISVVMELVKLIIS